jgi:hypothetical protein
VPYLTGKDVLAVINRDYILRVAERLGRELSIILGLRKRDRHEEALIYIDDVLLSSTGLTSRFIDTLSEEMLLRALSPLGSAHIDLSRWLSVAVLLKAEGDVYEDLGNSNASYYRYLKSLYLFLSVLKREPVDTDPHLAGMLHELLQQLSDYELPVTIKRQLFWYYEYKGQYAKAEDTLFEIADMSSETAELYAQGQAFYQRLLTKNDADLIAGHFSRDEIQEGMEKLQQVQF